MFSSLNECVASGRLNFHNVSAPLCELCERLSGTRGGRTQTALDATVDGSCWARVMRANGGGGDASSRHSSALKLPSRCPNCVRVLIVIRLLITVDTLHAHKN